MLTPTPRTVVRLFLLIAGLAFIWLGVQEGNLVNLLLGLLAAILGGFGLWWETREAMAADD